MRVAEPPARQFLYGVSVTFGARLLGFAITILASVIAARFLGPSGKGALAVIGLVSALAVQFGDLGLHASATYFTARNPEALPRIAALFLWIAVLLGSALSLLVVAIVWLFPQSLNEVPRRFLFIPVVSIPFALLSLYFQNILLGMQRIVAFNLVDLGAKAAGLTTVFVLLGIFGLGVWELLVAGLVIGAGASLLTAWLVVREAPPSTGIDRDLAREMLHYGMKFYLACVLAYLVIRVDLLMINYFRGVAEAGIYSVSVAFGDLLYMLPMAIGVVLFPRVARDHSAETGLTLKTCRYTVLLMAGLCLAAGLLARPLILTLYGPAFAESVRPFLWLLPGVFLLSIETIVARDLAGRGYPAILVAYWLGGLLLNVGLNLIAIPRWGATGAAVTSTVAYAAMFGLVFRCFLEQSGSSWRDALVLESQEVRGLCRRMRSLLTFQDAGAG